MTGGVAEVRERRSGESDVPCFELDQWRAEYGVVAGITGREGGFDLDLWGNDASGAVHSRWHAFRNSFGARFPGVVVGRQQHGNAINEYDQVFRGLLVVNGVDGHMTALRGVLLTVTVADCVPVYLVHPESRTVALLHAGWRGTAAGILEVGLELITRLAGVSGPDIVMHCGVGICGACYEVGSEVIESVVGEVAQGSRSLLDLRVNLAARAAQLGVRKVTTSSWCTAHDSSRFYSHRASGGRGEGRMAAYLGAPLA